MSIPITQMLQARAKLLRIVRKYFDDLGFIEVQTPCLSADNVVDAHIDPVEITGAATMLPRGPLNQGSIAETYYLQTSPEFAMKRLLAMGASSMYSLGPVFRAGERSARHNIEFTMLEWYEVNATMDEVISQTLELVALTLPDYPVRVVTYRDLFAHTLGLDPIDCPVERLEAEVATVDSSLAEALTGQRDDLLDVLLTERIEPMVAEESLLIRNYPLSQAALARQSEDDPQTAERFELMVHGLELANGYGELLDADELLARNHANNAKRIATGRKPLPVDSRLIDAMRAGLPPCAGVAMGFDRLVMKAIGTNEIEDVLTFPIETA